MPQWASAGIADKDQRLWGCGRTKILREHNGWTLVTYTNVFNQDVYQVWDARDKLAWNGYSQEQAFARFLLLVEEY